MPKQATGKALHKLISKRIDQAILRYAMIKPGDRILVGVSGGKDSSTLLYHLAGKQPSYHIPFELGALHIRTEYADHEALSAMQEQIDGWGVPFEIRTVTLAERLQQGFQVSCYWCSTQRRTELINYAKEHGYNRIALGHHMDDMLETFFMNMIQKSELSTMLPVMSYDSYSQSIIRPLAHVREAEIIRFAEEQQLRMTRCLCGLDTRSQRRKARDLVEFIVEREGESVRERLFESMHNPRLRYLLRRAEHGEDETGFGMSRDAIEERST